MTRWAQCAALASARCGPKYRPPIAVYQVVRADGHLLDAGRDDDAGLAAGERLLVQVRVEEQAGEGAA
ncbi:MAG TPA: hypothetical protein VLC95_08505 [Anaerolineae bacterium]|nr:hypothetical protein [Anaerolineae bacterium]